MRKKILAPSIRALWKHLGVNQGDITKYYNRVKNYAKREHSSVVGVVDPTELLPENSVFVTGSRKDKQGKRVQFGYQGGYIFIARHPCLVQRDTLKLKLVSKKPKKMPKAHWERLCGLPFGQIIFSTPKTKNSVSLPQSLGGDLDGDLYFICWNKSIIDHMRKVPQASSAIKQVMKERKANKTRKKVTKRNINWFSNVQNLIADIDMWREYELVSCLYRKVEKSRDTMGVSHPDTIALDAAYKNSLDLHKHGGKIILCKRLQEGIPKRLRHHVEELLMNT